MINFTTQITGFVHKAAPLPGILWAPIRGLSVAHWYWRWYYKKELYTNPENWIGLAAGHFTNAIYGDGRLRSVAHIVLISHRTRQYIDQTYLLKTRYKEFKAAFSESCCRPVKYRWEVPKGKNLISPSTWNKISYKSKNLLLRIDLIRVRFFSFIEQLFVAVMHAVEIYDAFYRRHEAFNEVFINIKEMLPTEVSWKVYLKENQVLIQKILDGCNIPVDLDIIVKKVN